MLAPVFIGDEVTAAGFRLAGVRIRVPETTELPRVVEWAKNNASLIFLTAQFAAMLGQDQQNVLLSQLDPPVVIIPDIRSATPVQDLATQLRAQLGVLE